jgi:hypothetical protein
MVDKLTMSGTISGSGMLSPAVGAGAPTEVRNTGAGKQVAHGPSRIGVLAALLSRSGRGYAAGRFSSRRQPPHQAGMVAQLDLVDPTGTLHFVLRNAGRSAARDVLVEIDPAVQPVPDFLAQPIPYVPPNWEARCVLGPMAPSEVLSSTYRVQLSWRDAVTGTRHSHTCELRMPSSHLIGAAASVL